MRTVHEVSKLTGVSIRTLHYYDRIGLLHPTETTLSGYRLYDDTALERLQCILLFRELQFPLKEIKRILDSPNFDRDKALDQQIALLELRKERLGELIDLAREIRRTGVKKLDFTAFDTKKLEEYAQQAKENWGNTEAYQEYEEKSRGKSKDEVQERNRRLMELFQGFAKLSDQTPDSAAVQEQVKKLQMYITEHFYTCTKEILRGLGTMYGTGGEMTENIDRASQIGTAKFAAEAIRFYCS